MQGLAEGVVFCASGLAKGVHFGNGPENGEP